MRVARAFGQIGLSKPALLTIGTFDGVHRGHLYLLEQAGQRAREHGYGLVVVTFDPNPGVVLRPGLGRYQLSTGSQKLQLLEKVGPELVALLTFSLELSQLSADEFMELLERRLELREVWFGEDFHFGHDRQGGLATLLERGRRAGFALHVVARRMEDASVISSSRVRQALAAGRVADAIPLLGRPAAIELDANGGGDARDYVTWSHLTIAPHLALPADGAYACLLSTPEQDASPRLAVVRAAQELDQVSVYPAAGVRAGGVLEVIDRLGELQDAAAAPDDYLDRARQLLARWVRPSYAPSGSY